MKAGYYFENIIEYNEVFSESVELPPWYLEFCEAEVGDVESDVDSMDLDYLVRQKEDDQEDVFIDADSEHESDDFDTKDLSRFLFRT